MLHILRLDSHTVSMISAEYRAAAMNTRVNARCPPQVVRQNFMSQLTTQLVTDRKSLQHTDSSGKNAKQGSMRHTEYSSESGQSHTRDEKQISLDCAYKESSKKQCHCHQLNQTAGKVHIVTYGNKHMSYS